MRGKLWSEKPELKPQGKHPAGSSKATPEERTRAAAAAAYQEVLDATKHQDDKVGRILTGISFLTAASIAFANMVEIGVTRRFSVGGHTQPLLAYAVGAYLLGVAMSVVLLLGSLTTSHTLPGRPSVGQPRRRSLIYFFPIVKHTTEEWRARWDNVDQVEADLRDDYIDETYNLARRTNHKYWRMNEAVAVLSFTLFCLGVAVVLGTGAAASRPPAGLAVPLDGPLRWALALYTAGYAAVLVLMSRRDEWLRYEELDPEVAKRRDRELVTLQWAAPALVALLVVSDTASWRVASVVAAAFVTGGWIAARGAGWRVTAIEVALGIGLALVALLPEDDVWRLAAAAAIPAAVAARTVVQLAGLMRAARYPRKRNEESVKAPSTSR